MAVTPEIGMGATIYMYSDRRAATVISCVSPCKIIIQEDHAIRTDNNGMSDSQSYRYESDKTGTKYTVRKNRHGVWKIERKNSLGGSLVGLDVRNAYYDYSF